ncbi:hypothetical protein IW262DRAFT_132422 [Armillaria fumosa]|nr:hypothetical protein IW262DRAFT_132422 [Armillaria fumosa]
MTTGSARVYRNVFYLDVLTSNGGLALESPISTRFYEPCSVYRKNRSCIGYRYLIDTSYVMPKTLKENQTAARYLSLLFPFLPTAIPPPTQRMKFTSILAFCVITFTAVSASPIDTNARRMAAGLPPLKPRNMYGIPFSCPSLGLPGVLCQTKYRRKRNANNPHYIATHQLSQLFLITFVVSCTLNPHAPLYHTRLTLDFWFNQFPFFRIPRGFFDVVQGFQM